MSRHVTPIILICVLLLAAVSCSAQPNLVDVLKKSHAAESKATLSGRLRTTAYVGSRSASSEVNIHRSGKRIRMEYATGPSAGSVIIDDGKSVIKLVPSVETAYVSQTPDAPERLDLLLANYRPLLAGSGSIAGRDCYILRVNPIHAGNPSRKLWIDKASLIALKTERYNSDGKLVMSSEYARADFRSRPSAAVFSIPQGWKTVRLAAQPGSSTLEEVRRSVGFTPVRPGYMPKGYQFDGYYVRESPNNVRFAGIRYTNGMNTISVFQRRAAGGRGFGLGRGGGRGAGRGGAGAGAGASSDACLQAENPNARMLRVASGELTIILVADVSASELQKIANSFE